MTDYFAVIRLKRNPAPQRVEVGASDTVGAIKALLYATKCTSTDEFEEYELYEVLKTDTLVYGYRPVSSRVAPVRQKALAPVLPALAPPERSTAMALVAKIEEKIITEAQYKPYQLATS